MVLYCPFAPDVVYTGNWFLSFVLRSRSLIIPEQKCAVVLRWLLQDPELWFALFTYCCCFWFYLRIRWCSGMRKGGFFCRSAPSRAGIVQAGGSRHSSWRFTRILVLHSWDQLHKHVIWDFWFGKKCGGFHFFQDPALIMVIYLQIPTGSFQAALVNRGECETAWAKQRVEFLFWG